MKQFKRINNISGWVVFLIAAIVYLSTIESTASFWDCGEFITSAYKLEVGHPPGAPFFMLVGNIFSQFASDPSRVALMINAMSALLSAFTILFLFWSITHLAKKLIVPIDHKTVSLGQTIAVVASGAVGALLYTFTDTFWFSAVEGEVYAFSSMLTALVFWLILKWEDDADNAHADKWIVLIAYIMGLSIGVHLLNLLCIPAIVLVYYFRKYQPTWKGGIIALVSSFALIAILMFGIIPGFTKVGGWVELFFVNTLGMSYNSGLIVYFVVLFAIMAWGIYETMSDKNNLTRQRIAFFLSLALSGVLFISGSAVLWVVLFAVAAFFTFRHKAITTHIMNLTMSCLMVILIGFSAYALIPIRSAANTPLDLNSPEDVFSLASYLNREQYGQTPLLKGTTYASQVARNADGSAVVKSEKTVYSQVVKKDASEKDRYVASTIPTYDYTNQMLFTRMHSHPMNPAFRNHSIGYNRWGGVENMGVPPTFMQNLQYLFSYQINFMYWRYFMWNFSGRQNDKQADGGITKGNWITGIGFIDEHVLGLGPQTDIAPDVADNKGRNAYYMLPLILGLIGMVYQLKLKERGFQNFAVVFILFFMTGLAIVLYLNQTPFEARERDYAYAGSFYAFCIWIGLGAAGISLFLRKYIKNTTTAAAVAGVACLLVPAQMASQNWDDHDRSGRTIARDTGMNYLSCVGEDGIIFTNGDNETYPLWYVQETEGYRTDVRVTNFSFLQTEWYIDQLKRQAYTSDPLPISWSRERYYDDMYAYVITKDEIVNVLQNSGIPAVSFTDYYDVNTYRDTYPLDDVLTAIKEKRKPALHPFNPEIDLVIPSRKLTLDVDSANVDWAALQSEPTHTMTIDLGNRSSVYTKDIMLLEILNNINKDNWKRPVHFATTISPDLFMNLDNGNLSLNGLTYQAIPGKPLTSGVNLEAAFQNMMNFRWGGLENDKDIYFDETARNMLATYRMYFSEMIEALVNAGKNDMALQALDKVTSMVPESVLPYGTEGILYARSYYRIGEKQKADALMAQIEDRLQRNINWYDRLRPEQMANTMTDIVYNNVRPLTLLATIYQEFNQTKFVALRDQLLERAQMYYSIGLKTPADMIVREITDNAIRAYYSAPSVAVTDSITDTTKSGSMAEQTMDMTVRLMQQYSPDLFKQYSGNQQ